LLVVIVFAAGFLKPLEALGGQGQRGTISGQVVLPSGLPVNERIKVTLTGTRVPYVISYTDTKGRFMFTGITDGTYMLEVQADIDLYFPVSQEVRVIYGAHPGIIISLREKTGTAKKSTTSVVSAGELDREVPEAAKKEFEKGVELSGKGKIKDAVERFKKAVTLYPNYLMARNNLGAQYLKLGQWGDAAEQFEAAIVIDSKAFNPRLNLAVAQIELRNYDQAVEQLNQAISIDSSSSAAHLYLGIASIGAGEIDQAERELSTSLSLGGPENSLPHFFLALVYMRKGERDPAVRELNAYLKKTPDGDKAPRAKQLLDKLKQ
jgi:tetratricopeptide (TPR) repeat protein